jgi:hypothetical protein
LGTGFFVHCRLVSAVKRVELVSDRMSYILVFLRIRLCNIIDSNVRAPSKEKNDDLNDSFYEELEKVFDQFLSTVRKFCYEILTPNWGERIFSHRQLGMRVYLSMVMVMVLERTLRHINNIAVKHDSTFPHRNIRKYSWTAPGGKTDYQIVHILIDTRWNKELFNDAVSC